MPWNRPLSIVFHHFMVTGIFYGHLVYPFCGHKASPRPFWYVVPRQIWQPGLECTSIFFLQDDHDQKRKLIETI
jgi:hypothetical protein